MSNASLKMVKPSKLTKPPIRQIPLASVVKSETDQAKTKSYVSYYY